jgi:hypothetical protein
VQVLVLYDASYTVVRSQRRNTAAAEWSEYCWASRALLWLSDSNAVGAAAAAAAVLTF